MKVFEVEQMKWNDGKVRKVSVPVIKLLGEPDYDLEKVFHYGQNHVQKQNTPSVSVGDIITWPNGDKYIVKGFGFEKITEDIYKILRETVKLSNDSEKNYKNRYDNLLWERLGELSLEYC